MMVFCEECNHTMSPQEDKASKSLYYVCRTCKHKIEAENTKVYARIVTGKKEYVSRVCVKAAPRRAVLLAAEKQGARGAVLAARGPCALRGSSDGGRRKRRAPHRRSRAARACPRMDGLPHLCLAGLC